MRTILDFILCVFEAVRNFYVNQKPYIIQRDDKPYLIRWFVIPRNQFFNIYVHQIIRSDYDEALHDHPWWNLSILLAGKYREYHNYAGHRGTSTVSSAGCFRFRQAQSPHRLELLSPWPCWTIFITGPKIREWGFYCKRGWVQADDFLDPNDSGKTLQGCEGPTSELGKKRPKHLINSFASGAARTISQSWRDNGGVAGSQETIDDLGNLIYKHFKRMSKPDTSL